VRGIAREIDKRGISRRIGRGFGAEQVSGMVG